MSPRKRTIDDVVVIAAAIRAIQLRGVANVRIQDISAESGLAPATLIQRFHTREALLDHVGARLIEDLRSAFREDFPSHVQTNQHLRFFLVHPSHNYAREFRTQLGMWLARKVEEGELPPHNVAYMAARIQTYLFGMAIAEAPDRLTAGAPTDAPLAQQVAHLFAAFESGGELT